VIGGSAVTNWLVDPFGKLRRNEIAIYSSSEREAKPQMIHVNPHDGIVVGSSRVTYIDPSSIDRYRLFNAGFSEAMPEEILEFLKLFAVKQRLVVAALDFIMFNERNYPMRKDAFAGIAPFPKTSVDAAHSRHGTLYPVLERSAFGCSSRRGRHRRADAELATDRQWRRR